MVAGACSAVNLIDGARGLAGGTALMMFGGLAAAAAASADWFVAIQALTVVGAIAGFLAWSCPGGKVFLGDAGAYFLGFMYAELSIAIVARNADISAWFVIALAAYPITETLYSIYRRKVLLRTASMEPDAGHLHSLVFRKRVLRGHSAHAHEAVRRANSRVAPRMWAHGVICLAAALWFHDSTLALIAFTASYAVAYVVSYRALARSGRRHADAQPKPRPARR
jgi:UDP-N-acetylmuramyl pentapeptide phosphotransferase/UDP-N-acetylglucosamine-1-phosphate transferase